jgi:thiol-disulfide isomerase/thioredoxin
VIRRTTARATAGPTRPKLALIVGALVIVLLAFVALCVGWLAGQGKSNAQVEQEKLVAPVISGAAPTSLTPAAVTPSVLYATTFTGLDGKSVSLGHWQNKLLVINFWATWCGPCKEEMPVFDRLQNKLSIKGVQIVGIGADSSANIANFVKNTPVAYPLLPDEAGAIALSKRLGNRLGLLPHTIVMRPGGEVVYAKLGVINEGEFEEILLKNIPK